MTNEPTPIKPPTRIDVLRQLQRHTELLARSNELLELLVEATIDILGATQSAAAASTPPPPPTPAHDPTPIPEPHRPAAPLLTLETYVRVEAEAGSKLKAHEMLAAFGRVPVERRKPLSATILRIGPQRYVERLLHRYRGDELPPRTYRRGSD